MIFNNLHWDICEGTGILKLGNPPSNLMTKAFFEELKEITMQIIPESNIHSLIITGNGRHFSSGADIGDLLGGISESGTEENKEVPEFLKENNRSFIAIMELEIPVIAAIHGICLGSALELAMFCHFRICADGALMALPEVSFNLMPGCGGTQRLPALAGRPRALELMLEGRNFNPEEALMWGIIDKITDKKELIPIAIAFANKIKVNYLKDKRDYYLKFLK